MIGAHARRGAANDQAGPARRVGADHVAGRDQQPEQKDERQQRRQDAPRSPQSADHAPHADILARKLMLHSHQSAFNESELNRFRIKFLVKGQVRKEKVISPSALGPASLRDLVVSEI
jgi:hypothetical protein